MNRNNKIIIVLVIALVFLTICIFFQFLDLKKVSKKEEIVKKPNVYICEKEEKTEDSTQKYREEISYLDDGKITDYKTGYVVEFESSKELDEFMNGIESSSMNYKVVDETNLFYYDNYDTEIKTNDGSVYPMWYKDSVSSRLNDGYNCYKGD